MNAIWVMVENLEGLTESVEAFERREDAVTEARERLRSHLRTRHDEVHSADDSWDDASDHGSCPCEDYIVGVYECQLHS